MTIYSLLRKIFFFLTLNGDAWEAITDGSRITSKRRYPVIKRFIIRNGSSDSDISIEFDDQSS